MGTSSFDDAQVRRIIEASPIDQIVSAYVRLRTDLPGRLKGSCPFQADKFASLSVVPGVRGGRYHCFECLADGNVVDFIMRIDRLNHDDAVEYPAERAGIQPSHPPVQTSYPRSTAMRTSLVGGLARGLGQRHPWIAATLVSLIAVTTAMLLEYGGREDPWRWKTLFPASVVTACIFDSFYLTDRRRRRSWLDR